MSTLVEAKVVGYQQTGVDTFATPKDVLFDFISAFEKRLREKGDYTGYLRIVLDHLTSGDVLISSRDTDTQSLLDTLGWHEPWRGDHGNWVMPVFTSLSGNKSDRYMHRIFTLASTPQADRCRITDTFTLDSTHTFSLSDAIGIKKLLYDFSVLPEKVDDLVRIEGNGPNIQYVRVLTPAGSILTDPMGHNITTVSGSGYTAFAFNVETNPLQTSTFSFAYATTPEDCSRDGHIYRQPGLANVEIVTK